LPHFTAAVHGEIGNPNIAAADDASLPPKHRSNSLDKFTPLRRLGKSQGRISFHGAVQVEEPGHGPVDIVHARAMP
jgi:hypothetical protein